MAGKQNSGGAKSEEWTSCLSPAHPFWRQTQNVTWYTLKINKPTCTSVFTFMCELLKLANGSPYSSNYSGFGLCVKLKWPPGLNYDNVDTIIVPIYLYWGLTTLKFKLSTGKQGDNTCGSIPLSVHQSIPSYLNHFYAYMHYIFFIGTWLVSWIFSFTWLNSSSLGPSGFNELCRHQYSFIA